MNTRCTSSLLVSALVLAAVVLWSGAVAQNNPSTMNGSSTPLVEVLPRLIEFSGELSPQITEMMLATAGESGNAGQSGIVTMGFSLYESQQGGAPLWTETQDVKVDEHGRYTVLLGAASPDGIPLDLFATARARWLGAQPQLPGATEQSRVALVGVPYALKAADADTLGGRPASAYVTTNVSSSASSTAGQGGASTNSATPAQGLSRAPGAKTAAHPPVAVASGVTGEGFTNDFAIWTASTTLGTSTLEEVGGELGLGTKEPEAELDVIASGDDPGVMGTSSENSGVVGESTTFFGVEGESKNAAGVYGESTSNNGVYGLSTDAYGVYGTSTSGGAGVVGYSKTHIGVEGGSATKGGVVGQSVSGDGVAGIACINGCGAAGVFGSGTLAGAFKGDVGVDGDFSVTGVKAFHIDHPLDPANKYLNHFAVESNEVLDAYSGNVTTDPSGTATVMLPAYFSALNVDYRYQLTVIGQFANAIVFREVENNNFVIKTDKPSVKVSWQVTGVRHDAWCRNHPPQVEEAKPQRERGYYLTPEFFGQPEEKSVTWLYHGDEIRDARAVGSRAAADSR